MDFLKKMAMRIRTRLREDWDAFIVIDGRERSGKSSLMLLFAALIDDNFKLDHIVYRGGNLIEKIYALPKYSVVVHDELGLDAFTRDAMTRTNKELIKAMMVCGDQNKCLIACMPNFWWLDTYLRDHRTHLWIRVTTVEIKNKLLRGFAEFRTPIENKWGGTPFWRLEGVYKFNAINNAVYEEYKKQKEIEIKKQIVEDSANEVPEREQIILDAYKRGISQYTIANVVGLSQPRVSQIIKELINNEI